MDAKIFESYLLSRTVALVGFWRMYPGPAFNSMVAVLLRLAADNSVNVTLPDVCPA